MIRCFSQTVSQNGRTYCLNAYIPTTDEVKRDGALILTYPHQAHGKVVWTGQVESEFLTFVYVWLRHNTFNRDVTTYIYGMFLTWCCEHDDVAIEGLDRDDVRMSIHLAQRLGALSEYNLS